MGSSTQITGGPVTNPGGDPLPGAQIQFTLIDPTTRRPVSAVDVLTSAIKVGTKTVTADGSALVDFEHPLNHDLSAALSDGETRLH